MTRKSVEKDVEAKAEMYIKGWNTCYSPNNTEEAKGRATIREGKKHLDIRGTSTMHTNSISEPKASPLSYMGFNPDPKLSIPITPTIP